jgi:hypothetical protein
MIVDSERPFHGHQLTVAAGRPIRMAAAYVAIDGRAGSPRKSRIVRDVFTVLRGQLGLRLESTKGGAPC